MDKIGLRTATNDKAGDTAFTDKKGGNEGLKTKEDVEHVDATGVAASAPGADKTASKLQDLNLIVDGFKAFTEKLDLATKAIGAAETAQAAVKKEGQDKGASTTVATYNNGGYLYTTEQKHSSNKEAKKDSTATANSGNKRLVKVEIK